MRRLIDRPTVEFVTQESDRIVDIVSAANGPNGWEIDAGLFMILWEAMEGIFK